MDSTNVAQLVVLIFLLLCSALFSSAETAMTTESKIRVRSLVEEKRKNAKTLMKIQDNSAKMLSAVLIGNNIVNLSASSLATVMAQDIFGNAAVSIATGILTIVVLLFGEITPKTLAPVHAEKLALLYAPLVWFLMQVLTPLILIINFLSSGLLKLTGVDSKAKTNLITESDLRTIVDVSHEEGILETEERQMIKNVFDLGETTAKDVMVPRIDMVMLDVNAGYDEVLETFKRERFTRIPVYEDSSDNIIGVLNVKDLLTAAPQPDFSLRSFLREPFFTYESKSLNDLMLEMKKAALNIVIVLDEYGDPAGLFTLEDILEELVGEIRDEYDFDEEDKISSITTTEYLVSGQTRIDDINEELGLSLASEEYESLAGLIMEKLDKIPEVGDSVELKSCTLTVMALDKKRVDKIQIILHPEPEPEAEEKKTLDKKILEKMNSEKKNPES